MDAADLAAACRARLGALREATRLRRVLVVDDSALVREAARIALEGDFEVVLAESGKQALELASSLPPDAIHRHAGRHRDRALPRRAQRLPWAGLPIILLTARRGAETVRSVFEAGADDYLNKPIVSAELVMRARNRLERVRLYRAMAETDALTGSPTAVARVRRSSSS